VVAIPQAEATIPEVVITVAEARLATTINAKMWKKENEKRGICEGSSFLLYIIGYSPLCISRCPSI
jgi:hypothetical protein